MAPGAYVCVLHDPFMVRHGAARGGRGLDGGRGECARARGHLSPAAARTHPHTPTHNVYSIKLQITPRPYINSCRWKLSGIVWRKVMGHTVAVAAAQEE